MRLSYTKDKGKSYELFKLYKGLVTNYREGGYKTGGGACEVLPLRKGRMEKVLAMLKGGRHEKVWGWFLRSSLKF